MSVALSRGHRRGSARRRRQLAREPGPSWSSSLGARSCCASWPSRCPAGRPTSPSTLPTPTPRRASAPTSRPSTAAASTCSSTTPAPPGAATSPRPATPTSTRHMELNFDAVVRLTEALLPLLRRQRPERDRQRRQHRRPRLPRPHRRLLGQQVRPDRLDRLASTRRSCRTASTSAWSCPASSPPRASRPTELRQKALTRWIVSKPEKVAEAIVRGRAGRQGRALRAAPLRARRRRPILAPRLVRRVLTGGAAADLTTSTER